MIKQVYFGNPLEKETKTTRQVIDETLGTENWDLTGLGVTETKVNFEKPQWVSVDIAKEVIAKLQKANIALADQLIALGSSNNTNGEKANE